MAVNQNFVDFVTDQLQTFGDVEPKKMFGGIGFFKEGKMFGMISGDTFRMKVDSENQEAYEDRGMRPYYDEKKKKGMPYWEVPPEVIENPEELAEWARAALDAALRSAK